MPATKKNGPSRASKPVDAIALLKADHRQVAVWFEEQPGGMFAQSRKRRMDLVALGERMAARKAELGARSPEGRGFLQTLTKVVSLGAGA